MKTMTLSALLCTSVLLGCSDPEAERARQQAAAAAENARKEQEAAVIAGHFEQAVSAGDWDRARLQGVSLADQYPDTAAAAAVAPRMDEVRLKAEAARELRRLRALWHYNQVAAGSGLQKSAAIYAMQPVDVDGSGAKPVQLVFRDHPQWKQHAYLVLQAGDFRCPGGCQVKVQVDDGPVRSMAAWRPDTDEAIAMFITDHRQLWKSAAGAGRLSIEFPVKAGGTRTAVFETKGLDTTTLPARWN
ncbi:hypothetical protein H4O09_09095 [Stenotrophomonas sp. W1S232]|jgi:hypothetical protein|uniref:Lipoprotein n=1 Tax=Stenotrophomonas koreensis TaxID=266128 RepID=A0A0R0BS15_9GAMM|nr:hypothetical protein [Stenotrophomonas koreensis]KRG60093.1 lipoprotein [Stenotrophomonas koreensis]MBB1117200.1 hypothetical protein [Stenotrophomonas koreensis]